VRNPQAPPHVSYQRPVMDDKRDALEQLRVIDVINADAIGP
jgi:hypothetical protein